MERLVDTSRLVTFRDRRYIGAYLYFHISRIDSDNFILENVDTNGFSLPEIINGNTIVFYNEDRAYQYNIENAEDGQVKIVSDDASVFNFIQEMD